MESNSNNPMAAAIMSFVNGGVSSNLPTQGVFQQLIPHNLALASMPLSVPRDTEKSPKPVEMDVPNLSSGEELSRPRSASQTSSLDDRPPAPEHRYPTRNSRKPRVSLRDIHPNLFSDSDEETSEEETSSTSEADVEATVTSQVRVKSGFAGQAATESRRLSAQRTITPHQPIYPSAKPAMPQFPKPARTRQTSTSTNASSATPPSSSSARTHFKPPLPRPPLPPLPGARQSQRKDGRVHNSTAYVSNGSSASPSSAPAPLTLRSAPQAPSSTSQPAKKRSSSPSQSLSLSPSEDRSRSSLHPPSPSILPKSSQDHASQSPETEPFETIIENYLRSQYGETKPGHDTLVEQSGAGDNRVGSRGESERSGHGRVDEHAMDVDREGSPTLTSTSSRHPSGLTPSRILETPDHIINKRKRSLESDDGSVPPKISSSSLRAHNGGSSDVDGADTYGSASPATKETRGTLSAPPTPISPTTKRPKYSYTKHPSHWAPDGNILVQIDSVRFKLHRSRLVKHSGYFRRVLESLAAGDGDEPVIVLDDTGVKVIDFEVLLDALEDFMDYFYTTPPFATAASILRASTTLSFDKYTVWAQNYLTNMWPMSIDRLSATRIPHAVESLTLTRECNIPTIRKRVLYELVRSPKFGQQPTGPRLSSADLDALGTVREELTTLWIDVTAVPSGSSLTKGLAVCGSQYPGCTTRDRARADSAHVKLVNSSGIFRDFVWDPVCGLQALTEQDWAGEGFCKECVELRKVVWRTMRGKVWEKLDALFRLTAPAVNVK